MNRIVVLFVGIVTLLGSARTVSVADKTDANDYIVTTGNLEMYTFDPNTPVDIHIDQFGNVGSCVPATGIMDITDVRCISRETVRRLCAFGSVCDVMGHQWRREHDDPTDLVYREHPPGYERQRCALCGKTRSRRLTDWE